jgi:uncharacterized protein YbjQ (UPF0145 family)
MRQVLVHGQTLLARALIEAVRVVADAAEQLLDQRGAAVGQFSLRADSPRLHATQDIQRRRRRIEADAVADAPVAGRVVGQNQRDALFAIGTRARSIQRRASSATKSMRSGCAR